jgi:BMFP domain-containing protein YqiC
MFALAKATAARREHQGEALRRAGRIAIVRALSLPETAMAQTTNRFFDEVARLMNDAAGVASGVRREFDTLVRTQAERILADLDVVKRDEFEAVKEMARLAREENEPLRKKLEDLEKKLGNAG